jgi:hypothetical protein
MTHQRKNLDAASIQANQNFKTFSGAFDAYAYNSSRRKIQQQSYVAKPRRYLPITSVAYFGKNKTIRKFEDSPRSKSIMWATRLAVHNG